MQWQLIVDKPVPPYSTYFHFVSPNPQCNQGSGRLLEVGWVEHGAKHMLL